MIRSSRSHPPRSTRTGRENLLYDPNYRQLDVEGYRVYRGRVDNPNELELLASFDYAGTVMADFQGQVNPIAGCAPELGINVGDTTCVVPFDSLQSGVAPTQFVDVPLVGEITQVKRGDRAALATGDALVLVGDTALTGAASGCLNDGDATQCSLRDTGVPFVYTDNQARNNLRYFYAVTAFDINSFQSGPSNLESARNTQAVTPVAPASNAPSVAVLTEIVEGRGVNASQDTTTPTIDASGRFSKKFPPANNVELSFAGGLAGPIFSGEGSITATLIALSIGDGRNACSGHVHLGNHLHHWCDGHDHDRHYAAHRQ